jgi:sugar phosphate isomerase/epimerase
MTLDQIAVQLYTLRDHCRTATDLAATAAKVRAIGYRAVQVSGVGPIPAAEIRRIMDSNGLIICATHEPAQEILDQPEKVIERLNVLGCSLTAYPYPAGVDFTRADDIEQLVRKLDASGAKLRAAGLTLGYHNHAIEFVKYRGAPVLEYIFAATSPEHIVAELDTYWVHYGGGDVTDWCRKLRGRQPFVHLKDYGFLPENRPTYCELGAGTLPLDRIVAEAEAGGCCWFIVEQDTCPGDPIESVAQSYRYLAELAHRG